MKSVSDLRTSRSRDVPTAAQRGSNARPWDQRPSRPWEDTCRCRRCSPTCTHQEQSKTTEHRLPRDYSIKTFLVEEKLIRTRQNTGVICWCGRCPRAVAPDPHAAPRSAVLRPAHGSRRLLPLPRPPAHAAGRLVRGSFSPGEAPPPPVVGRAGWLANASQRSRAAACAHPCSPRAARLADLAVNLGLAPSRPAIPPPERGARVDWRSGRSVSRAPAPRSGSPEDGGGGDGRRGRVSGARTPMPRRAAPRRRGAAAAAGAPRRRWEPRASRSAPSRGPAAEDMRRREGFGPAAGRRGGGPAGLAVLLSLLLGSGGAAPLPSAGAGEARGRSGLRAAGRGCGSAVPLRRPRLLRSRCALVPYRAPLLSRPPVWAVRISACRSPFRPWIAAGLPAGAAAPGGGRRFPRRECSPGCSALR